MFIKNDETKRFMQPQQHFKKDEAKSFVTNPERKNFTDNLL